MLALSRTEWKILIVVMLMGLSGLIGVDIHTPSLPAIALAMHTSIGTVQQSIPLFLLGEAVSLLFYGPLSDRYGRRPCVIVGLSIAVLSSYASVWSTSIDVFLFYRVLQGIGSGVCMGLGRTILADVIKGKRFMATGAYFSLILSLSPLLAPILGGYVQHWAGWDANFILLGSILLLVLVLYTLLCPETRDPKTHNLALPWHAVFQNYAVLARDRVFMVSVLLSGFAMAAIMVYATLSPTILQGDFKLSAVHYGWALGVVGLFGMLGKLAFPWFVKHFEASSNVFFGLWCTLLSGVVLLIAALIGHLSMWLLVLMPAIVMLGQSFVLPNTAAFALTPHDTMRGAAGALYGSVQLASGFIAAAVVSWTHFWSMYELIVIYLLFGVVGLWAFRSLMRYKRSQAA